MAPQVANWSNDGSEISTLVLVEDAEYDLQVSHSHVVFANWGQHGEVRRSCKCLVRASDSLFLMGTSFWGFDFCTPVGKASVSYRIDSPRERRSRHRSKRLHSAGDHCAVHAAIQG